MQNAPLPLTRDLVLIGGGHTHALFLRMWGMKPLPGVRLSVINPLPTAAYSGMLPGHIAGHYPREALQLDLVRLARHAGARLILGRAEGIDREARRIHVPGRAPIGYDIASIDIGITAEMPDLPGFADHVVPAKPLDAFADRWSGFVADPRKGRRVVVIGGGVAGVELALAAAHRIGPEGTFTVLEAAPEALSALGPGARRRLLAHCDRLGVRVETLAQVVAAQAGGVTLGDGRSIGADFVIGTGATRPAPWLQETGLRLHDGFVEVAPTLASVNDPAIFAAGDIAHMRHAPRPKAGVYAVRQAPVLMHNLRAALSGGRLRSYKPQRDYLKLVSTGDRRAVADKWRLPLDGAWLWRWKDRIDRRFMAMVHDLPQMPPAALPARVALGLREEVAGNKPLCGGCGAKMDRTGLIAALGELPRAGRQDVLTGPGDDAAVLRHGAQGGLQAITTDHVRAFSEDPWLLARIVAVHAMGDIWAMGATPQAALAQVTLPRMSRALQQRTLAEILAAATAEFAAAGAELVGGHTSIGAELTLGFTVTGLAQDGAILTNAGARPGDALILTKPLGTGVVLAAEMARAAPGAAVAHALAAMARGNAASAAILAPHAHAMTDVTGFGFAGHLMAILEASGCAATVDLSAMRFLPGAEALSLAGHGSSLLPANTEALSGLITAPDHPRLPLLFDPQTAGGLLAAVPSDEAADLLAALREAGEDAALVGTLSAGPPHLNVTA
jgi:selenide,water dikinase